MDSGSVTASGRADVSSVVGSGSVAKIVVGISVAVIVAGISVVVDSCALSMLPHDDNEVIVSIAMHIKSEPFAIITPYLS